MHIANLSIASALDSLRTSTGGLDPAEAERRRREFGFNRIEEVNRKPIWHHLWQTLFHFFAIILWIAAGLALLSESESPGQGMWQLGVAIIAVILINGGFSFWQEYRAERAMAALRNLLPQQAKVVREGRLQTVPADLLVPGDLIQLDEGDNIPADCRLIRASGLRVNTATITGEALPRARTPETDDVNPPLDARNILLAGTSVVSGNGLGIVYATGMNTEFGKIASLTQTAVEARSHLQQEIERLSRLIALLALMIGLIFFGIGFAVGLPMWTSLMFAIGIIVANVPEGLLPTVTLSLAMATQRMAKRNALIRHLPAVETLGSTTVICTDKTGTLTQNRMTVKQVFVHAATIDASAPEARSLLAGEDHLLRNARLCHNLKRGSRDGKESWLGDPMEIALVEFAVSVKDMNDATVIGELPFDSDRKRMSVMVERSGKRWLYCKGAPEVVLPLCERNDDKGLSAPLDEPARHLFSETHQQLAKSGLRVLAFAYRELPAEGAIGDIHDESGLTLSGLIGLQDPPLPGVDKAVSQCRSAGIKVIMVTGDHPDTAVAIAHQIGLIGDADPVVVQGDALRRMTPSQLQIVLDSPEILFTRVTAEQKMLVVQGLKSKGYIVAVTGDGVNDAPALKIAHIGIAMGSGTDVAKEASDMILLDDNFASIVSAIEEGRAVFENIRKFLTYILSSNVPELIPYLAFVLFRIPLPLTVIQILAVDLGTDMVPALALGAEKPAPQLMSRPPRPKGERLLSWPLLARSYLWLGMLEAVAAMTVFFIMLRMGGWEYGDMPGRLDPLYLQATTACFAMIVLTQIVNVFACRDPAESMLRGGLFRNPLLAQGIAVEIALAALIILLPVAREAFGTKPFPAHLWLFMIPIAVCFGLMEEIRKAFVRTFRRPPRELSPRRT